MKKYVLLLFSLMVYVSSCRSQETIIDPTIVLISDKIFEQSLLNQNMDSDGMLNGKIKREDAEKIIILDISHLDISSLAGIEGFINLTYLDCSFNKLTQIDISKNQLLESFDCSNNQITSLDLFQNLRLYAFNCSNNQLKSLDLVSKTLFGANCSNNLLNKITVVNCLKLNILTISKNQLAELNLVNNVDLAELRCENNMLKTIDLSKNLKLNFLNISNNLLSSLNLCANLRLFKLTCTSNNIQTIQVPNQNLSIFSSQPSIKDNQANLTSCN